MLRSPATLQSTVTDAFRRACDFQYAAPYIRAPKISVGHLTTIELYFQYYHAQWLA